MKLLRNFDRDESGQTLIEYSIIAVIIALGCVAMLGFLATRINSEFANIASKLT